MKIVVIILAAVCLATTTTQAVGAKRVTVAQAKRSIHAEGPQFGSSLSINGCHRSGRFVVCAIRETSVEYGGETWDFDYSACVDRRPSVSNTVESDACGWAAAN